MGAGQVADARYLRAWQLARRWGLGSWAPVEIDAAPVARACMPVFLSVEQLARRWGIQPRSIHERRRRGRLPPYQLIGDEMYFPLEALQRWEAADRRGSRPGVCRCH